MPSADQVPVKRATHGPATERPNLPKCGRTSSSFAAPPLAYAARSARKRYSDPRRTLRARSMYLRMSSLEAEPPLGRRSEGSADGRAIRGPSAIFPDGLFCLGRLVLACFAGFGSGELIVRDGASRTLLRGASATGSAFPSARLRQTAEDSVPMLIAFPPLAVMPAAAIARTMSRQLMPRCSAASNHHRCSVTSRASFFRPPPGNWKSAAIALRPASSSLLLVISSPSSRRTR